MTSVLPVKWRQQFAISLPDPTPGCIWIHACSVGEVNSIAPLIRALLGMDMPIHLTVITKTGMQHAHLKFGAGIGISYLPWDIPGQIARFARHLSPRLLLLTETEFWPGMLSACRRQGIPAVGLNTRISDRSFPRYLATRLLWRRWLNPVECFLAQSKVDAGRLQAIGVDKGRIQVPGHLKYAVSVPQVDTTALRRRLDASGTRPVILAASTHEGEEKAILSMWRGWRRLHPDLLLVMVPRHPQRFDTVAELISQQGLQLARWSGKYQDGVDAVLVDSMGVLAGLYAIADLVIMGGSLIPHGGQNPLEAAVCGRGVITGPYVQNFRGIMRDMQQAGAAIVAANAEEMDMAVQQLLAEPGELKQFHARAAAFMQDKSQVLEHVLAALQPYLGISPP